MDLELHYNVYGCFRDPHADIDLAATAVDAGFEGVWIGDHFLPWIDSRPYSHHVLPWFGALMATVPDVPVGTSVTCPMLRYRPPLLAQGIATLDNMFPGRFNLGVGVGEALNEAHFVDGDWPSWETRAEMLIESLDLLRTLWNTERYIRYDGEYFQYDRLKLYTQPKEDISIHWAGWGPKSCYNAGKYADHFLTAAPADLIEEKLIPNYKRGLDDADRDFRNRDITTELSVSIGDPNELIAEVRESGEYIPDNTELGNPDPRSIQRVADNRLAEMSDTDIAEAHGITTEPEDIVTTLEQLDEAGVTRVLVGSTCGDPYQTIETFEEYVFPALE